MSAASASTTTLYRDDRHAANCMHDNSLTVLDAAAYREAAPAEGTTVHIAILTFEGYNELDSLIALGVLNRVGGPDWRVSIACPAPARSGR